MRVNDAPQWRPFLSPLLHTTDYIHARVLTLHAAHCMYAARCGQTAHRVYSPLFLHVFLAISLGNSVFSTHPDKSFQSDLTDFMFVHPPVGKTRSICLIPTTICLILRHFVLLQSRTHSSACKMTTTSKLWCFNEI